MSERISEQDPGLIRIYRLRPWILLVLLLGLVGAVAAATRVEFDFTPQRIFQSDDPSFAQLKRIQGIFGRDDNLFLVHLQSQDIFQPEVVNTLRVLHEGLAKVPGVQAVEDLTTAYALRRGDIFPTPLLGASLEEARTVARNQALLHRRLISVDDKSTLIIVRLEEEVVGFDDLRPVVEGCTAVLEKTILPAGVEVSVTGIPTARVTIVQRLIDDQIRFFPVCTFLFIAILWFAFRDLRAVFLPLVSVLVAATFTAGLFGLTGEKVNIINNVLPVLIFVIAMSDAIHVVSRYRRELAAGVEQPQAIWTTLRHLAVACLLTSVTTAVGFGSLVTAKISILKRFGLYAALGVGIAYVITIVFLPLMFSYTKPTLSDAAVNVDQLMDRLSGFIGSWTLRHRKLLLGISAVLIGVSLWFASGLRVENNIYEAFSPDDPLVEANRRVERDFGGIVPVSLVVEWDPGTDVLSPEVLGYVRELQTFMHAQTLQTFSLIDLVEEWNFARHRGDPSKRHIPESAAACKQALFGISAALAQSGREHVLDRLWSRPERMLRITGITGDKGSSAANAIFDAIDARLARDADRQRVLGIRCMLSGDGPVASRGIDHLITDLLTSLLLAFGVIFPVMCLLLRSVRAGLVSMIPNMFPLVLVLGFMGAIGMDLRVTTVIVFTISLGLAVDDTIHFMARFQEEWKLEQGSGPGGYERAIERTFRGTGSAILLTTLMLGAGFSALLFSSFRISQTFALCMEITVFAALVGDLVILPAALAVFKPFKQTPAGDDLPPAGA